MSSGQFGRWENPNYLVINDITSASKFNKWETCLQKITTSLTNERHLLMNSYFTHMSFVY